MIMENKDKILKQNSLGSKIYIKFCLLAAGLVFLTVLSCVFAKPFCVVAGIYIGYKLLTLFLRAVGLVVSLVFAVISIITLLVITSLLIF
jgi:hypothetical protein